METRSHDILGSGQVSSFSAKCHIKTEIMTVCDFVATLMIHVLPHVMLATHSLRDVTCVSLNLKLYYLVHHSLVYVCIGVCLSLLLKSGNALSYIDITVSHCLKIRIRDLLTVHIYCFAGHFKKILTEVEHNFP